MKIKLIFTILFTIFATDTFADSAVRSFFDCYQNLSKKIPTAVEKQFLDSYLSYLNTGKKENGEIVIEKMHELAKTQGGKFAIEWVSLFEGSSELICAGESLGSVTLKELLPKVQKGWVTAINIVLTYEKLAKADGADAEGLEEYLKIIKQKHPWAVSMFKKSNK